MMFVLRPAFPEDQYAIHDLLKAVWDDDAGAIAFHGRAKTFVGAVAQQNGPLIGYAHARCSALHPTHLSVGVHVHPGFRKRGVGAALWHAIESEFSGSLKTATYADQIDAVRFLEQRDFVISLECHMPTIQPQQLAAAQVAHWKQQAEALGFSLLPMSALDRRHLRRELAQLHLDVYAHTHEHDPPALDTPEEAEADFLGDDLNPAWLWVALHGDTLAGVSSVRYSNQATHGELAWFGVPKAFADAGKELTLALTALALQSAAQDGVTLVDAELDSPDPNAMHLLSALPWQAGKVWLHLIQRG